MRLRILFVCLLLGAVIAPAAQIAAPTFDHLFPVALQLGTTNTVAAIGKFEPWPVKVWVDTPGIEFRAETNAGNFTVIIRQGEGHFAAGPQDPKPVVDFIVAKTQ